MALQTSSTPGRVITLRVRRFLKEALLLYESFDFELKLLSDDAVDFAQIFMSKTSNDPLSIPWS